MDDSRHDLLARITAGERRAIAQAITRIENAVPGADDLVRTLGAHRGKALVLGITGPPGAGKSTLINALLGELVRRELRIAVVAVDPSSPITGGAVLGDRVRMGEHGAHERVFIRSVSSRGHMGGLSRTTGAIVAVFDAAGFDIVIVETVGAGQSEVEITSLADTRVVVCPPGLGDDVQAIKAGILEIADLFVVNKGDLPAADATVRDLKDMLRLRRQGARDVAVLKTIATRGEGVAQVVDAALAHARQAGRGPRPAHQHALSRDELFALGRILDGRGDSLGFATEPPSRAIVDQLLDAARRTGESIGALAPGIRIAAVTGPACRLVADALAPVARTRGEGLDMALRDAPLFVVVGADGRDGSALVACGRVGQTIVVAARARGLEALVLDASQCAAGVARALGPAAAANAALAIAIGHPAPGGAISGAQDGLPRITMLGFGDAR